MRAALYVRVSTGRQAKEGMSLDEQKRRGSAYVEAQGWELVEIFEEAGRSGREGVERPALAAALEAAERGEFDVLIVSWLSRLGRNAKEALTNFDRLEKAGVAVASLKESIDTTTAGGKFMRTMLLGMAEYESDLNSERIRGLANTVRKQGRNYGRNPYGYATRGKGVLEIDEREAAVVRRIFKDWINGGRQQHIAQALNAEGVPTRSGKIWTQSQVRNILRNRTYIGEFLVDGEPVRGQHEPIVDEITWKRAQALLRSNRTGTGRPAKEVYLFMHGILRCGHCGFAMIPHTAYATHYYICRGRKERGAGTCPQEDVRQDKVDAGVLAYFSRYTGLTERLRELTATAAEEAAARARDARARAERELEDAQARLARVEADYVAGELRADLFTRMHDSLTAGVAVAQSELARLQRAEAEDATPAAESVARSFEALAECCSARDLPAARAHMRQLFGHFDLYRDESSQLARTALSGAITDEVIELGDHFIVPRLRENNAYGELSLLFSHLLR